MDSEVGGLKLAGSHDRVLSRSVEADSPNYRAAIAVAEKEAASFRKDSQEPPYADPHVRWCGRWEGKTSRRPDSILLLHSVFKLSPAPEDHCVESAADNCAAVHFQLRWSTPQSTLNLLVLVNQDSRDILTRRKSW